MSRLRECKYVDRGSRISDELKCKLHFQFRMCRIWYRHCKNKGIISEYSLVSSWPSFQGLSGIWNGAFVYEQLLSTGKNRIRSCLKHSYFFFLCSDSQFSLSLDFKICSLSPLLFSTRSPIRSPLFCLSDQSVLIQVLICRYFLSS